MLDNVDSMQKIEIAMVLSNSESQVEKFAAMYKSLQPQEEFLSFVPPNFDLLQEIRNQGEIVISNRNANAPYNNGGSNGSGSMVSAQAQNIARRPIVRQMSSSGNGSSQWSESSSPETLSQQNVIPPTIPTTSVNNTNNSSSSFVVSNKSYASIVKPPQSTTIIGQCIPGSQNHVSVKPALSPSNFHSVLLNILE